MGLYLVTDGDRRLWVAYEDEAKAQMYVWVPNTGRFHRNRGTEADFYWDQDHQYQPIVTAEARQLLREEVGKLDGRKKAGQLERFRGDTAALDPAAVLGDDADEVTPSPQRQAIAKARALAGAGTGVWLTWKTYPAERRQAAYVAASDLKRGKVRALHAVNGDVDARVVTTPEGQIQVQVARYETSEKGRAS